ncbi:MAG: hypothetical protein HQK59_05700 [Deltaproteobacteria bacterium]|nr:hypothetical protein [Deltaproteobacteria bacterium]
MGTLTLKYFDESVAAAVREFIETFPPHSIEIVPEPAQEWDHIPYASDEEQAEIEEALKNPDCHIVSSREKVNVQI